MNRPTRGFFVDIGSLLYRAERKVSGPWERKFVRDLRSRYNEWGSDMFMSDKQLEILEYIANRYG